MYRRLVYIYCILFFLCNSSYALDGFEKKEVESKPDKKFTKYISVGVLQYYNTWEVSFRGEIKLSNLNFNFGISSGLGKILSPHGIVNNASIGLSKRYNDLVLGVDLGCSFSFAKDMTYGYSSADEAYSNLTGIPINSFGSDNFSPFPWYPKKIIDIGFRTSFGYNFNKVRINVTGTFIKAEAIFNNQAYRPENKVFIIVPGIRLDFKL